MISFDLNDITALNLTRLNPNEFIIPQDIDEFLVLTTISVVAKNVLVGLFDRRYYDDKYEGKCV